MSPFYSTKELSLVHCCIPRILCLAFHWWLINVFRTTEYKEGPHFWQFSISLWHRLYTLELSFVLVKERPHNLCPLTHNLYKTESLTLGIVRAERWAGPGPKDTCVQQNKVAGKRSGLGARHTRVRIPALLFAVRPEAICLNLFSHLQNGIKWG